MSEEQGKIIRTAIEFEIWKKIWTKKIVAFQNTTTHNHADGKEFDCIRNEMPDLHAILSLMNGNRKLLSTFSLDFRKSPKWLCYNSLGNLINRFCCCSFRIRFIHSTGCLHLIPLIRFFFSIILIYIFIKYNKYSIYLFSIFVEF